MARLVLYSDMVLRFDNDAMESLIDPDKGVLEAFSVVNALIARAVLIVPSLLNSSGTLLRVGLDDLLSVAGTGKGICTFGVGEASADASVADILTRSVIHRFFWKNVWEKWTMFWFWCAAEVP